MNRNLFLSITLLIAFLWLAVAPATASNPPGVLADLDIYSDSLASGWQDWSWEITANPASATRVHTGSYSISVQYNAAWSALSLRAASPIQASGYSALDFWGYGGAGGTAISLSIQPTDTGDAPTSRNIDLPAGAWTHFTISLSELGSPGTIARLNWQDRSGGSQPAFYLDDIRLVGAATPPPSGQGPALQVDAALDRHPISPDIYGINMYADGIDTDGEMAVFLSELGLPLRRWGGNATSRYNYQTDISNHAMDWYFGNVKESNASNLPGDSRANRFIEANRQAGVQTVLTIPMSGYVSNGAAEACGFSVAKYGAQTATAAGDYRPDCGNGIRMDGTKITGNDPLDTSFAIGPDFVTGWVKFLVGRYGTAGSGGIRFYNLDNEPDLWWETQRDVAPIGQTYDQLRDKTLQYAAAVKAGDPAAQTLGPALGVWSYYFVSPYDGQREDWATPDDRLAHGNVPFVDWYLQQLRVYEQAHGQRLLDYLDLHYYPQAGVALVAAGDANRQARRLRSTRSLWDSTYQDESWIAQAGPDNGVVQLLPRMRRWVDTNYPGTKLAIGEYNWGALDHINGALAQADVLGIFGREGLDMAVLWAPPAPGDPGAFAFRMYRNYDGAGGKFGETGLRASSGDQERLAIYAAQRSTDKALTVMVINKTGGSLTSWLALANFMAGPAARVYRYSSADLTTIQGPASQPINAAGFSTSYPANSITLLVIPASQAAGGTKSIYLPIGRR